LSSAGDGGVVETGDEVEVHYTGTLDDGSQFDSSRERGEPLKFKVGSGKIIPGFNDAVLGLKVGGTRKVRVEPERAYGNRREDLVVRIPLEQVPGEVRKGQTLQLSNGMPAVVVDVGEDSAEIDANHRLAGQALNFDVELVSRTSPKERFPLKKSEDEWRSLLTDFEFQVLRMKGTEPAGTGEYDKFYPKDGYFACRACGAPLYSAASKFNSGCGWPAYDKCYRDSVAVEIDTSFGMKRIEILCNNCGGHLGHVFEGEQLTPTNERHCVNSVSVKYFEGAPPENIEEEKVL